MASARAPASAAKRVSLTQEQRANCGSTAGGHASLVSFARSASSSRSPTSAEFGSPSLIGAASPTSFQVTPPRSAASDFERAATTASEAQYRHNVHALSRKRQHPSVPKRMREPMTVDTLTRMMYELPCPSAVTAEQPMQEQLLTEQMACLEVQKRRRQGDTVVINAEQQHKDQGQSETVQSMTDGIDDGMTDDLCFLVDQVAIEESGKETKFMPYCL